MEDGENEKRPPASKVHTELFVWGVVNAALTSFQFSSHKLKL